MTVQPVDAFDPYSTTTAFGAKLPTFMSTYDAERVTAYQIYEQIYWNVPDTFKLVLRGEEDTSPIYVPTARTIVDTTNRYVAAKPGFVMLPQIGTSGDQDALKAALSALFKRERFWSKFRSNKLYGIMRGDWCWHVLANPAKPPGTRIKIEPLDPASYFPVPHPDDPDRIIAVHIMEQYIDDQGNVQIKRQTYQRGADPIGNDGSDTTIYNSVAIFDVEHWQAFSDKPVTVIKPPTPLPPQITAIPVYHVPNIESPGDPYGSSELRGFERILSAINQAVSDEEMILALEGLGMYETDGGPPKDENGNITDWMLGPGRVVEHARGTKFGRVTGVTSVQPMQDHLGFMIKALKEAASTPDIATGVVDVSVAESGIARLLQLSPLLAKVEDREDTIAGVHDQFLHDLNSWFAAYEGFTPNAQAEMAFGDPLPEDRDAKFKEILAIFGAQLADANWARAELEKLGYDFPADVAEAVLNEARARAQAVDPFATRMSEEMQQ